MPEAETEGAARSGKGELPGSNQRGEPTQMTTAVLLDTSRRHGAAGGRGIDAEMATMAVGHCGEDGESERKERAGKWAS